MLIGCGLRRVAQTPECTTTQFVARKIANPEDLIVRRDVADLGYA
jgi:type IV pilus biogenesis protein CpaD/CtpE